MKKLFIMASSLLLLLMVIPSAYANVVHYDTDIQNQFTIKNTDIGAAMHQTSYFHDDNDWTYEVGDIWDANIYVSSPRVYVDADYLQYVQIPNYIVYLDGTVETNAFDYAYVYIYNTETAEYPSTAITLTNYGPSGQSSYRLLTPRALNGPKWIQIKFSISLYGKGMDLSNNTHQKVKADFDFHVHPSQHNFHNRMRYYTASIRLSFNHGWINNIPWFSGKNFYSTVTLRNTTEFIPPTEPEEFDAISDLPATAGSVFSNTFGMGRVYFDVDGYHLIAKVEYQTPEKDEWYIPFTMASGTDMSIFSDAHETFYYQYEGQKFFLINHGQQSMFTSNNLRTQTWIDYTIWNLDTNEINTFERFNVYLYSKMEEANNVYGYFYVDEFVIDHLLSVTLAMRYQYAYMVGPNGPWNEYHKILQSTVQESFDPTSWQADFLLGAAAATTVLSFIPVVQIPALIIGSAVMGWVGSTVSQPPISFGTINQIQKVTAPTGALLNEINAAYTAANSSFSGISNDLSLFKLYIGQFNDWWSTGIKIDTEYSLYQEQKGINIIQFTYMTEGQIYTIDGEDIKIEFTPGPGTAQEPSIILPSFNISAIAGLIFGAVIAVIIIVSAASNGVFSTKRGFNFGGAFGTIFGAVAVGALVGFLIWLFVEYLFAGGLISFSVLR